MNDRTIKTREEFEALMREVDAALQGQRVPIHAREIGAMGEVAQRLGVDIICGPLRTPPIPGNYKGESLSGHILEWIRNRYGDRLKIPFANGYSVLLLRGDPWLLKFPVIYGKVTVVCDRDLSKQYPTFVMSRPDQPEQEAFFNVLRCIQNLPQGLANELTGSELREILGYFQFGHKFLNKLNSYCREGELAMTALADLNASAKMATVTPPEYGQSRWVSLQAAEKFLKYYTESKKANFPRIHELSTLAGLAVALGLPEIDSSVLKAAQCSAGVRYTTQIHSVVDVIEAHKSAMRIGSAVIEALHSNFRRIGV
jgi:hypothetical protein